MSKRRISKTRPSSTGKHLVTLLVLVGLCVLLLISIIRLLAKYHFVKNGRNQLQSELETTQQAINRMEESLHVLQTPSGTQRVLKEEFRVIEEGEELIVIVPNDASEQ